MKKYGLDHVCLVSQNVEGSIEFFHDVFGMEVLKTTGEAPKRKVWLDGGIQINEGSKYGDGEGGVDHFAIFVPEEETPEILEKVKDYGCTVLDRPGQWFLMPDGVLVELSRRNRTI